MVIDKDIEIERLKGEIQKIKIASENEIKKIKKIQQSNASKDLQNDTKSNLLGGLFSSFGNNRSSIGGGGGGSYRKKDPMNNTVSFDLMTGRYDEKKV